MNLFYYTFESLCVLWNIIPVFLGRGYFNDQYFAIHSFLQLVI